MLVIILTILTSSAHTSEGTPIVVEGRTPDGGTYIAVSSSSDPESPNQQSYASVQTSGTSPQYYQSLGTSSKYYEPSGTSSHYYQPSSTGLEYYRPSGTSPQYYSTFSQVGSSGRSFNTSPSFFGLHEDPRNLLARLLALFGTGGVAASGVTKQSAAQRSFSYY